MSIEHFLHEHTLSFFQEGNAEVICDGCIKLISGPYYGCINCDFFLHYECARLPRQVEHFFHPCPLVLNLEHHSYICNACFAWCSGFSYRCVTCPFNMHVGCISLSTISSENDEDLIQHFTHRHPLTLHDLSNRQAEDPQVFCAICEKLCSNSANGCLSCKFFLHNSCMTTIPRKINHLFHPHPLIFLTHPSYKCEGCEKRSSGFTYSCGKCRFTLDIKCGLLPTVESKGAHLIQHFSHPHPLALHENKEAGTRARGKCRCRACGEDCLESSFGCSILCNFFLHISCAELPKEIHHPLHLKHPLNLTLTPWMQPDSSDCSECSLPINWFLPFYHCYKCDFNLHKDCAHFTPSVKHESSLHTPTLCYKRPSPFDCNFCGEKAKKIFLRCVVCGSNMHLYCQPSAPTTITHRCHMHSLTLTKSPFKFELNSPENADDSDDEFYCDVCEEKRDKKDQVYYCSECRFIAEAGCVISELLPSLTASEDKNAMSSRLISEAEVTVAVVNKEIAELSEKSKLLIEQREPLKTQIENSTTNLGQLKASIQKIEAELNQMTKKLDNLEVKRGGKHAHLAPSGYLNYRISCTAMTHQSDASRSRNLVSNYGLRKKRLKTPVFSLLYTEDWIGLKALDDVGRIHFISVPEAHLGISRNDIKKKSLFLLYTEDWIGLKALDDAGKVHFICVPEAHFGISRNDIKKKACCALLEGSNLDSSKLSLLYTEDWISLKALDDAGRVHFISVPEAHLGISRNDIKKKACCALLEGSNLDSFKLSLLYTEDWIGLKALDDAGRVHFISVPEAHLEIFRNDIKKKSLFLLYTEDWIGLKALNDAGRVHFISIPEAHFGIFRNDIKRSLLCLT
ncbi:hypothetical protein DITRI_Ditri07aG0157200 [Diplodiscus trichospermus]